MVFKTRTHVLFRLENIHVLILVAYVLSFWQMKEEEEGYGPVLRRGS